LGKLDVRADVGKNRLSLTVAGIINKKGLGKLYTELRFCVPDLQPGFELIADLSGCTLAFLEIIPTFKNIMNYLLSNGAGEMVGIMPSDALLYKQIKLATIFQGYKPSFVSTFAEAEEKLATINRRTALRLVLPRQVVKYRVNNQEYDALLHDISTGGCVIEIPSPALTVGEKLSVVIPLFKRENGQDLSTIEAEVVRVEAEQFAVEFVTVDNDMKKMLWKFLVKEAQQDIDFS
jgi:PilZ domain